MRTALLASAVVFLSGANIAAADQPILQPMIVTPGETKPDWVHTGERYVATHKQTRVFDRRKLGLPCVMPPDMQVALAWPGPACAYTDNFIFMPHRYRQHVK
jgi:hypothetical protein